MNKEQLQVLSDVTCKLITASDLKDQTPRTLLYGWICSGDTWHVYIDYNTEGDAEIHTVCYYGDNMAEIDVKYNAMFVPDKRLYPEYCDYEFCSLLLKHGEHLPFTSYNEPTKTGQFFGEKL